MRRYGIIGIMAILSVVLTSRAYATAILTLDDGAGNQITISDNGGTDMDATLGTVHWFGTLGAWTINVTVGDTKPAFGTATDPKMDLQVGAKTQAAFGGGTLTVMFNDTGFGPIAANSYFSDKLGGTFGGTASAEQYYDANNGSITVGSTPPGIQIATLGPLGPGSDSVTVSSSGVAGTAPFSLTQLVAINHAGGAQQLTTLDFEKTTVPEPASLLLLGSGLLGFGYLGRRRQKRV